jgi:parvulin-like peptidyl-prolyl isomerase
LDKNKSRTKNGGSKSDKDKYGLPLFVKYGLIALALIVAIAIGLVIYFDSVGTTVATIDGEKITAGEYSYYLESQKQMMYYSATMEAPEITEETFWATKIGGEDALDVATRIAMDQLKYTKIQYKLAREAGVSLTDKQKTDLSETIQKTIDEFGGGNEIIANNAIKDEYGFSLDDLKNSMTQLYIIQNHQSTEIEKVSDADADIISNYNSNPEIFTGDTSSRKGAGEAVWARHILITFPQEATEEDVEATRLKAEELIDRLQAGEDFATLAKEYSEDGSAQWGGDYLFGRGNMVSEFENAAFSLAPGQITDTPVKTVYGYHIIKLEEKYGEGEPPSLKCVEEYREFDANFVKVQMYEQKIKSLFDNAKFELNQENYNAVINAVK